MDLDPTTGALSAYTRPLNKKRRQKRIRTGRAAGYFLENKNGHMSTTRKQLLDAGSQLLWTPGGNR